MSADSAVSPPAGAAHAQETANRIAWTLAVPAGGETTLRYRVRVEESFRARVWIVSPTTLMATLNTVRAVLKDVRMREQAGVIQTEVRLVLEDVLRLDDRVGKLQRHFDQASEDVRQIRISTEKVSKRAERIEELELEAPELEAPELEAPELEAPDSPAEALGQKTPTND